MQIDPQDYANLLSCDQLAFTQECFLQVSPAAEYKHNWHIDCIVEHLQAVERGEIRRLIINVPPAFMKSITVSTAWVAWLLGQNPSTNVFVAS